MHSELRLGTRLAPSKTVLRLVVLASLGLPACSGSSAGLSGRYQAKEGTGADAGTVTIDFTGGNKANVSLGTAGNEYQLTHHCVYTVDRDRITFTTDEPMGVPMSLLIEGSTLRDPGGFVFTKK